MKYAITSWVLLLVSMMASFACGQTIILNGNNGSVEEGLKHLGKAPVPTKQYTAAEIDTFLADLAAADEAKRMSAVKALEDARVLPARVTDPLVAAAHAHLLALLDTPASNTMFDSDPPAPPLDEPTPEGLHLQPKDSSVADLESVTARLAQDFRRWITNPPRGESYSPTYRGVLVGHVAYSERVAAGVINDRSRPRERSEGWWRPVAGRSNRQGENGYVMYDIKLNDIAKGAEGSCQQFKFSDKAFARVMERKVREDEESKPMKLARLKWEIVPHTVMDNAGNISGLTYEHVASDVQFYDDGRKAWTPWMLESTWTHFAPIKRAGASAVLPLVNLIANGKIDEANTPDFIVLQMEKRVLRELDATARREAIRSLIQASKLSKDKRVQARCSSLASDMQSVLASETSETRPRR